MAHKTLIGVTANSVVGGTTLVSGTSYRISAGKTLVGGTGYSLSFGASAVPYSLDDWPGWSNATWEDINNLCYAKQQGYINSWPADVVLGATKTATVDLESATDLDQLLNSSVLYRIIDIDKDANGTLTFDSPACCKSATVSVGGYSPVWNNRQSICSLIYNALEIKDYITPVEKTRGDTTETSNLWFPSLAELGISQTSYYSGEYTVNGSSRYAYYTDNNTRKKYTIGQEDYYPTGNYYYFTRTKQTDNQYQVALVQRSQGSFGVGYDVSSTSSNAAYPIPYFVIGNPLAQTIE